MELLRESKLLLTLQILVQGQNVHWRIGVLYLMEKKKVVDRKMWYWCIHHKMEGVYDGIYVGHPEDDHDQWEERKINWKKKKNESTSDDPLSTLESNTKKCTLSNSLKAHCTEAEANILWSEVVKNSSLN